MVVQRVEWRSAGSAPDLGGSPELRWDVFSSTAWAAFRAQIRSAKLSRRNRCASRLPLRGFGGSGMAIVAIDPGHRVA